MKFTLSIRGDTIGEYEITSQDGWVFQLRDFEVDDGYEIAEESVAGYTTTVSGNITEGFVITNTLVEDAPSENQTAPGENQTADDTQAKDETITETTTTTTTTTASPSKDNNTNTTSPVKDKHNTGNPVLLGLAAISAAGMIALRRKE